MGDVVADAPTDFVHCSNDEGSWNSTIPFWSPTLRLFYKKRMS